MKFIKRAISAILASTVLLGMGTISYADGVNSAADGIYLDGNNIIAEAGTTVTENDGSWTVTESLTAENTAMEFSLKALLPIAGEYTLSIASDKAAEVKVNGKAITLPTPTGDAAPYTYTVRDAEFVAGINEIKFAITGDANTAATFTLYSVTITLPTTKLTVKGNEYSYTGNAWVTEKTEENLTYWAYGGKETPFYAEYQFYTQEDGEYSLSGSLSYPKGSEYGDTKYYSQCSIIWDGFKNGTNVTSTPITDTADFMGTSSYTGIMLKKGIHTLRIVPTIASTSKKYNLNVGELTLTKTGDYAEVAKTIEIMGNEYSSLGGLTIENKSDLVLKSTGETFSDWKFSKSELTSAATDTATYSVEAPTAGYYSFEGWMNINGNQWVSENTVKINAAEIALDTDSEVTETNTDKKEKIYITKKTVKNTSSRIWLDEGPNTVEIIFSPTKNSQGKNENEDDANAAINGRIWKLLFTLISEDDVYIPAQNYTSSEITPTAASSTIGEDAVEYLTFKDDSRTTAATATYKFTPEFTGTYSFEAWASDVASYLSAPVFKLNNVTINTTADRSTKTEDTYVCAYDANGVELTAGTEYTLTVEFQPKTNDGKINGKLWKMAFNRELGETPERAITKEETADNTLTGSFYVEPQANSSTGYVIYAQYEDNVLKNVIMKDVTLEKSDAFSTATFGIDLPSDYASMDMKKLFVFGLNNAPLFNALELN